MDALIPFSAALSVTIFKAAVKVHNMDDEVMARVKAKPGQAMYVMNTGIPRVVLPSFHKWIL